MEKGRKLMSYTVEEESVNDLTSEFNNFFKRLEGRNPEVKGFSVSHGDGPRLVQAVIVEVDEP
jgi:hypothetical protein